MATIVKFSGVDGDGLKVEEDANAILDLWRTGDGTPLGLTASNGAEVYVNTLRIAYLREIADNDARRALSGGSVPASTPRIR